MKSKVHEPDSFNPTKTAELMRELARYKCGEIQLALHQGQRPSEIDWLLTEVAALQVEAKEIERW